MSDNSILPKAQSQLVDQAGRPTRAFYNFFNTLVSQFQTQINTIRDVVTRLAAVIAALGGDAGNLPDIPGMIAGKADKAETLRGTQSVRGGGDLSSPRLFALDGDMDNPPALSFYGVLTDGLGRGWQLMSGNFIALDNGDGTYALDLADLADSGAGAALVKITRDAKGRLSGTSAATTTDLAEGTNLYYTDARADARITLQKAQPLGLATLDAGGKLDAGQLPALAITETFVVNTQTAMLALSAQEGDVAVRTDLSRSFILTAAPASTLSNWQELLTPMSPVTSVFGRTGSVTPASGDYTPAQVGAEPAITAGTTAQYRRGDKTWRDFATDVRTAVLTGLSTATSAVIAATDTVLQAFGKLQAQITDNLLPAGYIDGLKMVWVSGTAFTVTSGAAYVPSLSKVLRVSADIAKTGLSLTASTWYHVYLYDNAGTPDVEVVTTAPASAYNGTARAKTGDTSRRYVGSVKTLSSGGIAAFDVVSDLLLYVADDEGTFRVLYNASATVITDIDVSSWIPFTARLGYFRFQVNGGSYSYVMPGGSPNVSRADLVAAAGASVGLGVGPCRLGNGQKIAYMAHDSSTPTYIWVKGYYVER